MSRRSAATKRVRPARGKCSRGLRRIACSWRSLAGSARFLSASVVYLTDYGYLLRSPWTERCRPATSAPRRWRHGLRGQTVLAWCVAACIGRHFWTTSAVCACRSRALAGRVDPLDARGVMVLRAGVETSSESHGVSPGISSRVAQLFLDPHQLVVLCDPLGAGGRARLDLPYTRRDDEIGNEGVLRLARAV